MEKLAEYFPTSAHVRSASVKLTTSSGWHQFGGLLVNWHQRPLTQKIINTLHYYFFRQIPGNILHHPISSLQSSLQPPCLTSHTTLTTDPLQINYFNQHRHKVSFQKKLVQTTVSNGKKSLPPPVGLFQWLIALPTRVWICSNFCLQTMDFVMHLEAKRQRFVICSHSIYSLTKPTCHPPKRKVENFWTDTRGMLANPLNTPNQPFWRCPVHHPWVAYTWTEDKSNRIHAYNRGKV